MGAFSFLNKEIAIDLGTANTIVIYNDKVVVDEPSIVAIQRDTKKIIAVGKKAMMMHGKTHENIKTIRPLRDGVIADFQAAEHMMREMIKMINFKNTLFPPSLKMVICIPSGITEVEERAVKDSAEQAGAKEVRHCPHAGPGPQGAVHGRAAVQPGRQAPHGNAHRAQAFAPGYGFHLRLRDP